MEATVNGTRLHYEDLGEGQAVVLIHAFPLNGNMWQPQLVALSDHYRCIVPDLRGFGSSDVPPGPYPMQTYADDLAALLDELGLEQAVLVGLSMGGYVAFAFLRHYPHRVRGLVLADTRATPDTEQARAGREANANLAETDGASAIADKMLPNLLSPAAPTELTIQLRSIIEATSPQGIAGALRGMGMRPDSTDLLGQINVPTLLLVGAEDSLSPPDEMRTLQEAIPNSVLVEVPAAGHIANMENPAVFTAALEQFLSRL